MSTPRLIQLQSHRIGAGFQADGWHEPLALLDPFIMAEHFRMSEAAFAPHPHAGLSAVTYLFDDSGAMVSRDSMGGEHLIAPAGVHWMLGGSGVMHDEYPADPGCEAHGLQVLVNLPAEQKLRAPALLRLAAEQMPHRAGPGWRAVQVFGGSAALALPSPAALSIVDIDAGAAFDIELPQAEQGFALAIHGSGVAGELPLSTGCALSLPEGGCARIVAESALRIALFSGQPLRQPLVRHGPFAMSDEGQVVAALHRFQTGGMGRLSPRSFPRTPFSTDNKDSQP